ncbi:hypothetical protein [Bacteroides ihuae]|uniref:hypothetical protein n=1 Tax=Bacteroides ihuae TaxID=1852362 RepID=UPI0008DADB4D|nr:hypothetical protein [Bacteroides ihuae]
MADEFDIVDYVYEAVDGANTGMTIYKDNSITGEVNNHIVINHLNINSNDDEEIDFIAVLPVNVNVFVKLNPNGMVNRTAMKAAVRAIRASLKNISTTDGQYRHAHIAWEGRIESAKDGFDCMNIRLDFETDK